MASITFSLLACMLVACVAADVLPDPARPVEMAEFSHADQVAEADFQATKPLMEQPGGKSIPADANARTKKDVLLSTISYPYIYYPTATLVSRSAYPSKYQPNYYPSVLPYQYYPSSAYYYKK